MATLILSAAGAALGAKVGGAVLGLSGMVIGRAIGATLGRVIDQQLLGRGSGAVETGRIDRLRVTGAGEGAPLPRVWGRMRLPGHVVWASGFREIPGERRRQGGKFGPKVSDAPTYSVSLALALCEGPIDGVGRIWADGVEIDRQTVTLRIYPGDADQLPDPVIAGATQPADDDEDDEVDAAEEERRWAEAAARIAAAAEAPARDLPSELADELADEGTTTGHPAEPAVGLASEPAPVATQADDRDAESRVIAEMVERQRRAILREVSGEDAVARLISQTDQQLSGAEAQHRRSTMSHLKAAVLATRAEQEATGEIPSAAPTEAELARYREDLEQTMRAGAGEQPRRPMRSIAQRTERPVAAQPPLVLVSEQRVDRPAYTDAVTPRRIAAEDIAHDELFDEVEPVRAPLGKAFTDFVGPMQLTTLTEMTEAAAAYITHVGGQEDFARPTVMRLVTSTNAPMTRSRENLLRAFGILMRQGTLRRSRRGQFEIATDSGFVEQARRFAAR
jgi:hypothetical protein